MDISEPFFETIWSRFDDFEMSKEPASICPYAQALSSWTAPVLEGVSHDPSVVAVNQAIVLLVNKYFDFFSFAPKRHRYHLSPRGHKCIFQVFLESFQQLKAIELSLTPPMLFIPAPTPPPPPVQIAGIPLAEVIGGEE